MLSPSIIKRLVFPIALAFLSALAPVSAHAQNRFTSGSTGADGAFSPTGNQTIQVPASGVFNYTTISIPAGVTITYAANARNTPVTLLASGDVAIAGAINLRGADANANGSGGIGGPGGFTGGAGGYFFGTVAGSSGDGPGGGGGGGANGDDPGGGGGGGFAGNGGSGSANNNSIAGAAGPRYGSGSLLPLIGGSGGGGGGARINGSGGGGGGGGGAILIASSTTITFTGNINANGGSGFHPTTGSANGGGGGGGAGGAIRLVANTVTGSGILNVQGGGNGFSAVGRHGGFGSAGFVRIEAFDFRGFNPSLPSSSASFAPPNPVTLPNSPSLRIASVGSVAAPASPAGSLSGVPDIVLPSTQSNPVTIAIEGANLPLGTTAQVTLIPAIGQRITAQSSPLAGTAASSSATASLSLPSGTSLLMATVVVDLSSPGAQAMFIDGERVSRIEVAAAYGGVSELTYITQSGRRIKKTD